MADVEYEYEFESGKDPREILDIVCRFAKPANMIVSEIERVTLNPEIVGIRDCILLSRQNKLMVCKVERSNDNDLSYMTFNYPYRLTILYNRDFIMCDMTAVWTRRHAAHRIQRYWRRVLARRAEALRKLRAPIMH